jgi:hypothetical protein
VEPAPGVDSRAVRPAVIGCLAVAACTDSSRGLSALEQAVVSPTYGEEPVAPPMTGHTWRDSIDARGSFANGHYWVVWRSGVLGAVRVSAAGAVLDDPSIVLAGPQNVWTDDTTFDGTSHAVVWTERQDFDIRFARYGDDGTMVQAERVVATASSLPQDLHAVAAADGLVLVVWTPSGAPSETRAVRVAPDGTVLDVPPILISAGTSGGFTHCGVATDGTDFLVAVPADGDTNVRATRLLHDGGVLDPGPSIVVVQDAGFIDGVTAAFGAGSYLVLANSSPATPPDTLIGQRVSPGGGLVSGPFAAASGPAQMFAPMASFDGTVFWVEYTDYRRDPNYGDVYAARVDANGVPLDPSGVEIARSGTERESDTLISGPGVRLALWDDSRWGVNVGYFVWAVPLDANAQATAAPALLSRGRVARLSPSIATDGTRYTVTWTDERNGNDIYAGHFALDGRPLDDGGVFVGFEGDTFERAPVVMFDGGELIAFTSKTSDGGLMISALDAAGVAHAQRLSTTGRFPAVALGPGQALVAWYEAAGGVQAQRLALDGTALGGPLTLTTSTSANVPRVTWDGQEYLVLWADFSAPRVLVAERVTAAGALLDGPGKPVLGPNVFDFRMLTVNAQTVVAWSALDQPDGGASLYLNALDPALQLEDAGIFIAPVDTPAFVDDLAWDSTSLIVSVRAVLYAASLDAGLITQGGPFGTAGGAGAVVAAQQDGGGMVAWELDPSGAPPDVHVALLGASPDAGQLADGGLAQPDAGTAGDAGTPAQRSFAIGCGCASEDGAPALLLLLLMGARRGAARAAPSTRAGRRPCHRR